MRSQWSLSLSAWMCCSSGPSYGHGCWRMSASSWCSGRSTSGSCEPDVLTRPGRPAQDPIGLVAVTRDERSVGLVRGQHVCTGSLERLPVPDVPRDEAFHAYGLVGGLEVPDLVQLLPRGVPVGMQQVVALRDDEPYGYGYRDGGVHRVLDLAAVLGRVHDVVSARTQPGEHRGVPRGVERVRRPAAKAPVVNRDHRPVSYTHLTLPTNREV